MASTTFRGKLIGVDALVEFEGPWPALWRRTCYERKKETVGMAHRSIRRLGLKAEDGLWDGFLISSFPTLREYISAEGLGDRAQRPSCDLLSVREIPLSKQPNL